MAGTWLRLKSEGFFLAPKIWFSARKSVFSYGTPFFGKVALVTLGVGSVLAPSDLVCDFSFPSYVRFREGNPADAPKVLPNPTVGAPSASNSPSALSAQALRARALRARAG